VTNPTYAWLKKAIDHLEEGHHAIMFLYKADRQKYGELVEQREINSLQKKDHFQRSMNDTCSILASWKNKFCNNGDMYTEANDGIAFMTMGKED